MELCIGKFRIPYLYFQLIILWLRTDAVVLSFTETQNHRMPLQLSHDRTLLTKKLERAVCDWKRGICSASWCESQESKEVADGATKSSKDYKEAQEILEAPWQ